MKINSIQYLRAIAAILVVYAHSLNFMGGGDS
jgi:peptidoglycan/LPS O-acetylase OafA/YrhL